MNETKQRYHPLTLAAFILAVFLLIAPLQADIIFVALHLKRTVQALFAVAISLAIVVLPLIASQVQTRRHPEKWKQRFLAKLTWGIVILNVVFNFFVFANFMKRDTEANQASQTIGSETSPQSGR